ncbi:M35 family metallo-endopeptidase [Yoonia sp. 2307UL14-13]|uniref:M35 family metallo-endopeptidase n=1 Tax=Yoonia sp. 2307UL14-13 TaxID=3126506 RepID=UPI003098BAFA
MTRLSFIAIMIGMWATPVAAENFAGCDKAEMRVASDALSKAKDLTLKAAATVGDTPQYRRWFGEYSPGHAEEVRAGLKAVVTAIRSGAVTVQCDDTTMDGCEGGTYAWVYPHEHYRLYLCPAFFNLPRLIELRPGARASENGTREGTIVHELSHFNRVARTEDHCYSRPECSDMAREDPLLAIENADSFQYFTEDVTYFARQPVAGKPGAADRED